MSEIILKVGCKAEEINKIASFEADWSECSHYFTKTCQCRDFYSYKNDNFQQKNY